MPLRRKDTKNHKMLILYKLHYVKLSVFGVFVAYYDFSEWIYT